MVRVDFMSGSYITDRNRNPIIYLMCRDENKKRVVIRKPNVRPWFFIEALGDSTREGIDGEKLERVSYQHPQDTANLRKQYGRTWRAKMPFVYNWLSSQGIWDGIEVDKNGRCEPAEPIGIRPRICYFDIEVSSPSEIMPRPEDPQYPIITFQWRDSYTGTMGVEMLEHPDAKKVDYDWVTYHDEEEKLIQAIPKLNRKWEWDGWMAHFGNQFDWPYYYRRSRRLFLNVSRLSPVGTFFVTERFNPQIKRKVYDVNIGGNEALDSLEMYSVLTKPEGRKRYGFDLKLIVRNECGFYYEDYGDQIERLWSSDHETLARYGRNDVIALHKLNEHRKLVDRFDSIRRVFGCPMQLATKNIPFIHMYLTRMSDVMGKEIPTWRYAESPKYKGATVQEGDTVAGFHRFLGIFDLASLPYHSRIPILRGNRVILPQIGEYNPQPKDKALCWLENQPRWKLVKRKFVHKNKFGYYLRITLKSNKQVCVTENHSVYKVTQDGLQLTLGSNLQKGDYLFTLKKVNLPTMRESTNPKGIGFWIADGWASNAPNGSYHLSQKDSSKFNIYEDYSRIDYKDEPRITIKGLIRDELKQCVRLTPSGKYSYTKTILPLCLLSQQQKEEVLDGWLLGDGVKRDNRILTVWYDNLRAELPIFLASMNIASSRHKGAYHLYRQDDDRRQQLGSLLIEKRWVVSRLKKANMKVSIFPTHSLKSRVRTAWRKLPQYAKDLVSDIINEYAGPERIKKIERIKYDDSLFDIEVEDAHNFFTSDLVLVHNSMYPNIIVSLNLSLETKYREAGLPKWHREPEGILPFALKRLMAKREEIRASRKHLPATSPEWWDLYYYDQAFKYAVNSFYGAMKKIDPDIAAKTTEIGRSMIMTLKEEIERDGYEVIYWDTDSLFVRLGTEDWEIGNGVEAVLQNKLYDFSEELNAQFPFRIKYEAFYRRALIHKSKHYCAHATMEDKQSCDEFIVKGITFKKSDSALLSQMTGEALLKAAVKHDMPEVARMAVKGVYDTMPTLPWWYSFIPKGRTKPLDQYARPSAWIKGAKNSMEALGMRFPEDRKMQLMYTKPTYKFPYTEMCFEGIETGDEEHLKGIKIDWDKMRDKVLRLKLEPFLKYIGYDWSAITEGVQQRPLERFFG